MTSLLLIRLAIDVNSKFPSQLIILVTLRLIPRGLVLRFVSARADGVLERLFLASELAGHDGTPDHSRALTGCLPAAFCFCPSESECRFLRVTFILWAMFSHSLMHNNLCC